MYETLFNIAGPAILAWVLMIFAPKWRVTQWLVRSAIVPALLAVLYVIGIAEVSAAPLATAFLLAVWAGIGLFAFWRWAATPATRL